MSKSGLFLIAGVFVITLLALIYFAFTYEAPEGNSTVVLPNPVAEPEEPDLDAEPVSPNLPTIRLEPEPEPAAVAEPEPEVAPAPEEVEMPAEPEEPETADLPSLNDSDTFVLDQLQALQNGAALVQRLADEELIRKFVALVDNLSRGSFPQSGLPYKGMEGEMPVQTLDDNLFIMDDSAYARFDEVISTFVATDTDAAMALYRTLSPLFQRAYAELGYGDAEFDDALRLAIDNVLDTTQMEGPFQLVKPSVMYLYADARIENLSDVHKQLLRLGPENSAKLKDKLREFSARL